MASLIGIARVKNEADFIEYFARYNSSTLDELYIIDDHSSDNTTVVIAALIQEGLVTELHHIDDRKTRLFNLQGEVLTQLMRHAASKQKEDECFIFPLDADEIILGSREDIINQLRTLAPDEYGLIKWKTFAPINGGLATSQVPLCSSFRPLLREQTIFYKAVIPIQHAHHANIRMGNHDVISAISRLEPRVLDIDLCHFPVRSADQITSKALVAAHKTYLKNKAVEGENFHIIRLANQLRQLKYKPTDSELSSLALNYLAKGGNEELDVDFDMMKAFPPMIPKYKSERINPIGALDELLHDIINAEVKPSGRRSRLIGRLRRLWRALQGHSREPAKGVGMLSRALSPNEGRSRSNQSSFR